MSFNSFLCNLYLKQLLLFFLKKSINENVGSKLITRIQSMFSVVKAYAKYKVWMLKLFEPKIGVKQG